MITKLSLLSANFYLEGNVVKEMPQCVHQVSAEILPSCSSGRWCFPFHFCPLLIAFHSMRLQAGQDGTVHRQRTLRYEPAEGQPYLDRKTRMVCIPKQRVPSLSSQDISLLRRQAQCHTVKRLSGADGRIVCGENHTVMGCRRLPDGRVEYLIRWSGVSA